MKMNNLCIRGHLGLGDTIITAPIVRAKAQLYDLVCVLAKHHNVPSTEYLFRDCPNVVIRGVLDDEDANFFFNQVWKSEKLGLGMFGTGYVGSSWDTSMYLQAGVEFSDRWNKWECKRDEVGEEKVYQETVEAEYQENWPHLFYHDDHSRGMEIDFRKAPDHMRFNLIRPASNITPILFHWRKVIEACDEIHCIASSFAAFIDSIVLPKKPKLFLHKYCRPGEALMQVNKNWTILE